MKLISIGEFQSIVQCSDAAILWLLKQNKLPCQIDKKNGLLIDIHAVEVKTLVEGIAALKQEVHATILDQAAELVGAQVVTFVEEILSEAEQRVASMPGGLVKRS